MRNTAGWPRLACGLAIAAVAVAAGWVSYTHIYELTLALHGSQATARLMPIAVDGMMTVGSVVLLQSGGLLGWAGIIPGVGISIFANVESGIRWGALAATWAAVPAISFAIATLILERWLKNQARKTVPATVLHSVPDAPVNVPEPVAVTVAAVPVVAVQPPAKRASRRAPVSTLHEIFAADIASRELPSLRDVKTRAHAGTDKARDIRNQLAALMEAA